MSKHVDVRQNLRVVAGMEMASPLWKRVPLRTDDGKFCADFMMLISGFSSATSVTQAVYTGSIADALRVYQESILLAELNCKIGTLWVSHYARKGLGLEIASAVHHVLPQAKLVSQLFRNE